MRVRLIDAMAIGVCAREVRGCYLAVFVLLLGFSASARGETTVHVTEGSFLGAIEPGYYMEDFSGVTRGAVDHLEFSDGRRRNNFRYEVSTVPGSVDGLFNENIGGDVVISISERDDVMLVTFTGDPVTAVGGNFWASDTFFEIISASVTIGLSDGTVETYGATGPSDFRGFTTSGPAISSFTVDAVEAWPTMDNLYVGVIPEPTSAAVLGLGVSVVLRRRVW